jgi:hypothetical protein
MKRTAIAAGVTIAGTLGFGALGLGAGIANAAPNFSDAPQIPWSQDHDGGGHWGHGGDDWGGDGGGWGGGDWGGGWGGGPGWGWLPPPCASVGWVSGCI